MSGQMNLIACKKCFKTEFQILTDDKSTKVKCIACNDVSELKVREPRSEKKKKRSIGDMIMNGPDWAR